MLILSVSLLSLSLNKIPFERGRGKHLYQNITFNFFYQFFLHYFTRPYGKCGKTDGKVKIL